MSITDARFLQGSQLAQLPCKRVASLRQSVLPSIIYVPAHGVPVTFVSEQDVTCHSDTASFVRQVVACLKDAGRYARLNARMPSGVLLTGAPGTGKTLLGERNLSGRSAMHHIMLSPERTGRSLITSDDQCTARSTASCLVALTSSRSTLCTPRCTIRCAARSVHPVTCNLHTFLASL